MGSKTLRDGYFAEILAERLSVDDGMPESPLERGVRLEQQAIEAFESATGKITEEIGFIDRDDNQFAALSPDRLIFNNGRYSEAVEIKCLSSANHIQAWLKDEIPKDYYAQVIQYFIVNDDLETLYFVLYDPRVTIHPIHIIPVDRVNIEQDIKEYKEKEYEFIQEVEDTIKKLIEF